MNIPDEAAKRYPEDYKTIGGNADRRRSFAEGAAWARREALREAADAVENLPGSTATGYYASEQDSGYRDAQNDAERAIRALAEGEQG